MTKKSVTAPPMCQRAALTLDVSSPITTTKDSPHFTLDWCMETRLELKNRGMFNYWGT